VPGAINRTVTHFRPLTLSKDQLALDLPPGIWQTFWFGSLQRSPISPSSFDIHTFFRLTGGTSDLPIGTIRHVPVSLAHMHLLPLGRSIVGGGGELLSVNPLFSGKKRTVTIDLSPENTSIVSRSRIDLRGPAGDWSRRAEYDGLLILAKQTATTPQVLIPCASLFQFYWGVSSTLADAVLTGKLEDLERYFYAPEHHYLSKACHFNLEVRRQWDDVEVPYLATLLADPVAIQSGRSIFRQVIASSQYQQQSKPLQLEVTPPFPVLTRIHGIFHTASDGSGESTDRLILTRILSADLTPNWKSLEFTRENDNRRKNALDTEDVDNQNTDPPKEPITLPGRANKKKGTSIEESPSGYSSDGSALPLLARLKKRFPTLQDLPAKRVIRDSSSQSVSRVRHRRGVGPWSAISGSASKGNGVLHGKLVGGSDAKLDSVEPDSDMLATTSVESQLSEFAESFISDRISFVPSDQFVSVKAHFLDSS